MKQIRMYALSSVVIVIMISGLWGCAAPQQSVPIVKETPQQSLDSQTLLEQAKTSLQKEQYEQAIAEFTRVLDERPDHVWALFYRGQAYAALKQDENAFADFSQTVLLDPQHHQGHIQRGKMYSRYQRYDEAITDFTQAIAAAPQNYKSYLLRGNTYEKQGQYQQALDDFIKVRELFPKHSNIERKIQKLQQNL